MRSSLTRRTSSNQVQTTGLLNNSKEFKSPQTQTSFLKNKLKSAKQKKLVQSFNSSLRSKAKLFDKEKSLKTIDDSDRGKRRNVQFNENQLLKNADLEQDEHADMESTQIEPRKCRSQSKDQRLSECSADDSEEKY